jgi:hypothetical protein
MTDPKGNVLAELSGYLGAKTNNVAEYSGLLACLEWALDEGHPHLRVVSDSELMVKQIQGKYKVKSPELRPLFDEAVAWANVQPPRRPMSLQHHPSQPAQRSCADSRAMEPSTCWGAPRCRKASSSRSFQSDPTTGLYRPPLQRIAS